MSPQEPTPPASWTKCSSRSSRCRGQGAWGTALGSTQVHGGWGQVLAGLSVTSGVVAPAGGRLRETARVARAVLKTFFG